VLKLFILCLALFGHLAQAKEITTNEIIMPNAPEWMREGRVEKVTDHIQHHLDWSTRKTTVRWHFSEADYDRAQGFGAMSLAITKYTGGVASIELGPQVNDANFDEVFGHELVHVIIFQKYKDVIPKWLEEGLANYFSTLNMPTLKVDYKWLASQPFPHDVHELAHPFSGTSAQIRYRYKASQAFAEMLAKKCDLEVLIGMSAKNKMEDYMRTYCEIKDLNEAFHTWVRQKASAP
jgi:hypothetical protein